MNVKHVICKNNVLQVAKVASVDSSLKALKNKGEGDGSEAFQDACDVEKVQKVADYFSCF